MSSELKMCAKYKKYQFALTGKQGRKVLCKIFVIFIYIATGALRMGTLQTERIGIDEA